MTTDDYRKMIRELLSDDSDRLNAWECEFLDSVNQQQELSDKQRAIIDRIWQRIFK